MTAANEQIVEAYETLGMSPEEISEDQSLDIVAIKAVLMQCSTLYRKECQVKEENNFTTEQERLAIDVISQIVAGYTEADENTRLRAAMFLRNDRRGRLDVVKQSAGLNINVLMMHEQMKKAIAAMERAKTAKSIDVVSSVTVEK